MRWDDDEDDVQTCQLTRTRRVKPAIESQTRLTRAVAENPLEMADKLHTKLVNHVQE